jgi:hypothetical protein
MYALELYLSDYSPKPPVKKNIVFLFSKKIGFKAYYDKTYYGVNFPDFLNKGKNHICHRLPDGLFTTPSSPTSKPRNLRAECWSVLEMGRR